jgi:hypothetical protein
LPTIQVYIDSGFGKINALDSNDYLIDSVTTLADLTNAKTAVYSKAPNTTNNTQVDANGYGYTYTTIKLGLKAGTEGAANAAATTVDGKNTEVSAGTKIYVKISTDDYSSKDDETITIEL